MFSVLWWNDSTAPSLTLKAQLVECPSDVLTSEPRKAKGPGFEVAGVNAQDGDCALERLDKIRLAECKSQPSGLEKAEEHRSSATGLPHFTHYSPFIATWLLINSQLLSNLFGMILFFAISKKATFRFFRNVTFPNGWMDVISGTRALNNDLELFFFSFLFFPLQLWSWWWRRSMIEVFLLDVFAVRSPSVKRSCFHSITVD